MDAKNYLEKEDIDIERIRDIINTPTIKVHM